MTNYRARAACRGLDTELFFPIDERPGSAGVAQATAVCAGCPVQAECLAESLAVGDEFGIFGGLTAAERRALRAHAA